MPNIASAAKAMRQNAKRRARNRAQRAHLRTMIKKARRLIETGQVEPARQQLPETLSVIGKAARKGLIHRNKAARHASRLMRRLNALTQPAKS